MQPVALLQQSSHTGAAGIVHACAELPCSGGGRLLIQHSTLLLEPRTCHMCNMCLRHVLLPLQHPTLTKPQLCLTLCQTRVLVLRRLKRAGLDYWPHVCVKVHDSWQAFYDYFTSLPGPKRLIGYSVYGATYYAGPGGCQLGQVRP
jgi:hypothetical protein